MIRKIYLNDFPIFLNKCPNINEAINISKIYKEKLPGIRCRSFNYGYFVIKKYINRQNVIIEFENTKNIRRASCRSDTPIGVSRIQSGNSYMARIGNVYGFKKSLGSFSTPENAFYAYKQAKEEVIQHVAKIYKDKIDSRAYDALMNYKVEITD